ncbi:MAG TPA: hypothetical protein VK324_15980 [Tepidisphaeraceae bacterium]|nr:hypothetical protein [Tepidisphaeraceae bacterium]
MTGKSIWRFCAGLASYAAVAYAIFRLDSLAGAQLVRRFGLGSFHEPVLWLLAVGFVAFVACAQVRWRWTGFTLGVVTGVVLTLVGAGVFFVLWARGMGQLH